VRGSSARARGRGGRRRTAEAPRVAVALVIERDIVLLPARDLHNVPVLERALDEERLGLRVEQDARACDVLAALRASKAARVSARTRRLESVKWEGEGRTLPLPRTPFSPVPTAYTLPVSVRSSEWLMPALAATTFSSSMPPPRMRLNEATCSVPSSCPHWPLTFHPALHASPASVTRTVWPLPHAACTMRCSLRAGATLTSGRDESGKGSGAMGVGEGRPSVARCGIVRCGGSGHVSCLCSLRPRTYASPSTARRSEGPSQHGPRGRGRLGSERR